MNNDLISRQAAIEALRTMQTYKLSAGDDLILIDKADVQTELMMLPPAHEQRWIPVTERLPEKGKDVLVTRYYDGRAGNNKSCRYVEVASCNGIRDDITWNSYSDEYKMSPRNHYVIAWCELPEPYQGDRNENR